MAEAWWCVCAHCDSLCGLLVQLCALNNVLDDFLLVSSLLVVAPPYWSLVFTFKTEMFAGTTRVLTLVALLPSQTACEAPCKIAISSVFKRDGSLHCLERLSSPVRDRRCIFEAACFAALAVVVVPTMVEGCLTVDVSAEEGDMAMYVLKPRAMVQTLVNNATNARRDDVQGTGWQGSAGCS